MNQNTSKAQLDYVLLSLSTVLFLSIFYLLYLTLRGSGTSIAIPLGLLPIAIFNTILGSKMISKPKP
jgi:hypothetical protein